MHEGTTAPIVELLDWISTTPRSYAETLDAWKTHCPRLTTWEDVRSFGLVAIERTDRGSRVVLTDAGVSAHQRAHA